MDMTSIPKDVGSLLAIVLLLGIRHGFDADHLAAIDSLARLHGNAGSRTARSAGALFSLGHGAVVIPISIGAAVMAHQFQLPAWLQSLGVWISISLLTVLAILNIASVFRTPADQATRLVGWRSGLFGPLLRTGGGWSALIVGALFAISFDTISQATLFALLSTRFGGWLTAVGLSVLFVIGMMLVDGLNGLWLASLLRRADRRARTASRVMALAVAAVGLATAFVGAASELSPGFDGWFEDKALWFGAGILVAVTAAFGLAIRLAAPRTPSPAGIRAS